MGAILLLSGGTFSAEETGSVVEPVLRWLLPWATPSQIAALHLLVRKVAHLVEYGLLAALWRRALSREGWPAARATRVALAVSVGWAFVDEGRQSLEPTRGGSVVDVAVDAAGAILTLAWLAGDGRRAADRAATALLWVTAVGGVAALVVNAIAGVPSIALWITTPAATLLLLRRRRRASS
jgi:VanZ family protein